MQVAIMRSAIAARIRADAFASSCQRLDLGSIFGAKHQSSRTPPVERHGTPRNRPTRTDRQQQGRAPNQDKRRLGARQQRQPSRGRGTRGPRSIGLLMNNETMRWGWGRALLLLACRWGWMCLGRWSWRWSGYASAPHRRGCVSEGRWFAKSDLGRYVLLLVPWFSLVAIMVADIFLKESNPCRRRRRVMP